MQIEFGSIHNTAVRFVSLIPNHKSSLEIQSQFFDPGYMLSTLIMSILRSLVYKIARRFFDNKTNYLKILFGLEQLSVKGKKAKC